MRRAGILACIIGLFGLCGFAAAGADVQRTTEIVEFDQEPLTIDSVDEFGNIVPEEVEGIGGEQILITGTVRITTTTIRDANGKYHYRLDTDYRVSAVGAISGVSYDVKNRAVDNVNTVDLFDADAPGEATSNSYVVITTRNKAFMIRIRAVAHVTLNPNGTITSSFFHFSLYEG